MPKPSLAADQLPASAAKALRDLGENLALARQRRKESLRAWASRMAVSVPTLLRCGSWADMRRCPKWQPRRKT